MTPAIFAGFYMKKRDGSLRTPEECILMCKNAGYTTIDWSPCYERPTWQDEVKAAARAAEKHGVTVIQSHTPYNFYKKAPLDFFKMQLGQSIEAAAILGVKDLVFHFDEYHPTPDSPFDPEKAVDVIYEIMAPYIEKTASLGINAALETIIEDRQTRTHFGGDYAELEASLAKFNDEYVTCCWDFGHAELAYKEKHAENLKKMGKRISCTHVHDNYYERDLHLLPCLGKLEWETLIPALRSTGYDGALTFEGGYGCIPDGLTPEYINFSYGIMDYLSKIK